MGDCDICGHCVDHWMGEGAKLARTELDSLRSRVAELEAENQGLRDGWDNARFHLNLARRETAQERKRADTLLARANALQKRMEELEGVIWRCNRIFRTLRERNHSPHRQDGCGHCQAIEIALEAIEALSPPTTKADMDAQAKRALGLIERTFASDCSCQNGEHDGLCERKRPPTTKADEKK